MMNISALKSKIDYCNDLCAYSRRVTRVVDIGDLPLGGSNPIRVQSMTVIDTMDTIGSVKQAIRMVEAGSEYIRITAPSINEAQNLENIKKELRKKGYNVPLIADIHFTPNAAEIAARLVEKVRINPGNYADKKKFETIEYTDKGYDEELNRIREKFTPLVKICKEYGTAMRIGTNHGSLSDRILSRYGDTPLGMVESALEFLRICEDLNYYDVVLSMKASNTRVMVQAYRLLVNKLEREGLQPYPLHLGVTEAGEGEDGRIKSAVGTGTLLEDGLGDTIRVSLTEEPEFELPVAKKLVERYTDRWDHESITSVGINPIDPFFYTRRPTSGERNIGNEQIPIVIADLSKLGELSIKDLNSVGHYYLSEPDKWRTGDQAADFIYTGQNPCKFEFTQGLFEIVDAPYLQTAKLSYQFPLFKGDDLKADYQIHPELNFLGIDIYSLDTSIIETLKEEGKWVLFLRTDNRHGMAEQRRVFYDLIEKGFNLPVIIVREYNISDDDRFQLYSATDLGGLLIDGFGDGVMLQSLSEGTREQKLNRVESYTKTAFGILQAARTRMSKTEYISCPSCGRTLFDLQKTTAAIRERTDHLKGVKIGIMGCIVNGPGEMADADFGYVGTGKGKITLYKGQEVVKRGVPSEKAVDELIELIKDHGAWIEPDINT